MTNYNNGDDDGNDEIYEDDNVASGSVSDGTIFDPITTPRNCRGSGDDRNSAVAAANYISTLLKMCHKLLYAKFGGFDWCHCHIKNP